MELVVTPNASAIMSYNEDVLFKGYSVPFIGTSPSSAGVTSILTLTLGLSSSDGSDKELDDTLNGVEVLDTEADGPSFPFPLVVDARIRDIRDAA